MTLHLTTKLQKSNGIAKWWLCWLHEGKKPKEGEGHISSLRKRVEEVTTLRAKSHWKLEDPGRHYLLRTNNGQGERESNTRTVN